MVLDRAAADRLTLEVDDEELAGGWADLLRQGRGADGRTEAARGATVEFGDVLRQAVLRVRMLRGDRPDLHARLGQRGHREPPCRRVLRRLIHHNTARLSDESVSAMVLQPLEKVST